MVTRSPAFRPQKSRSRAANSFTRTYSSRYVNDIGVSDSCSGTKIKAALFLYFARWRSTQLYEALSLPPTNHFQNGGSLVSSVVCQYWSQFNMSAYSRKHSGYLSSLNRLRMSGSVRFAWPMNFEEGY